MAQKKETSLLAEDDWRGWLQQRPTQEFLAGIVAKLEWMKEQSASGKWSNPASSDSTQFENGAGLGYIKALKDVLMNGDVLPDAIADEMPEVIKKIPHVTVAEAQECPILARIIETPEDGCIGIMRNYRDFILDVAYYSQVESLWKRIKDVVTGFREKEKFHHVKVDLNQCDIRQVEAFAEALLRAVKPKS